MTSPATTSEVAAIALLGARLELLAIHLDSLAFPSRSSAHSWKSWAPPWCRGRSEKKSRT
jgi:hypothetical protein